ncbi:methyltransferase domain-containing protein [Streptomyces sp. NPDC088258]|uniref:methyltransferase domain-containing protein n=1 Tax=Streptomyces sp. NPDC088258 TaxID=3365849 RepID=UPI00383033E5
MTGDDQAAPLSPPPDWVSAFTALPRSAFLPDLMWPHDMETKRNVAVSKSEDPGAWYAYAGSNSPIVTQWDDGAHEGVAPGKVFTSSSSMPSLVASMLADLDVRSGHRVLEVGSGTGWNAALLAHRVGAENVVTVELDAAVAESARAALARVGLPVRVVHGDGLLGYPRGAPYDRTVATCGLRAVPFAWVEQAAPGGVILVPWGTYFSFTEATARLVVAEDGRSASGPFTQPVNFMRVRSQRLLWPEHSAYVPAEGTDVAEKSSTSITEADFLASDTADIVSFAIGLRLRDCTHVADRKRDGVRPVWFYGLTDRSWAVVVFRDGRSEARVHQSGPRRLWAEVETAYRWWEKHGKPEFTRFGLTVAATGQRAWLDDPADSWPVG